MAGTFINFGQLPLEIQQIILSQSHVATRRSVSRAFSDLKLYEHCRTPITRKELDTFISLKRKYRIGIFSPEPPSANDYSPASGTVIIPWEPGLKISQRYYGIYLYKRPSTSQFDLYIDTERPVGVWPVEFPDTFKLDYKTSYDILKTRINCRFIENYPKRYILDQFDEYVHQINYDNLYSLALAYTFLSLNRDLLYPDISVQEKRDIISFQKSPLTGKLVPIDIGEYQDLVKQYADQVNDLILKVRAALDKLE